MMATDSENRKDPVLPKLPIPPLEDTCARYIKVLEPLQTPKEHEKTKSVVQRFLKTDGPLLHARLQEYASTKASFIEEFWYESYLQHSDSVVLSLNPFFILEDDPTPSRGNQLTRAASLILASVGFVHDLRSGQLEPDNVRGKPLDMYQYSKLFGSARIPTRDGCQMKTFGDSKHVVVMRRGQFYSFDVMDSEHRPVLSERELWNNLYSIIQDADKLPISKVAQSSIGLLTTERRPTWATLRQELIDDPHSPNKDCLHLIDSALFIVCLDGSSPRTADAICATMLCGTYELGRRGVQVGTCLNRWYDKLQIIVCADGQAGVNFEHSAVDGATVLRFVGDIYTELILRFAKSINKNSLTLFKNQPSPWAQHASSKNLPNLPDHAADMPEEEINTSPQKLEWQLSNTLKASIRFAETRLSDLICQNEVLALEFEEYGKNFIISQNLSPDAFVQMAFQVCYFSLYGRIESTYEPAMTKAFSHGRTEGIRSVSPSSVKFIKNFCSDVDNQTKISALREACEYHQNLSKQCSQGLGQDRILFAMYSLAQQELHQESSGHSSDDSSNDEEEDRHPNRKLKKLPKIFRDSGYGLLNHSTLSTSNCGNPALRLFGFGPVVSDGYGIGYIIREDGLSFVISSKHLQTRRFVESLRAYFLEIRRILLSVTESANPNVDPPLSITKRNQHRHHLPDSARKLSYNHRHQPKALDSSEWNTFWNDKLVKVDPPHRKDHSTGSDDARPEKDQTQHDEEPLTAGYGFFDSGEIDKIISSHAENVRNDNSKKKFKPPIGTKLEAVDD
ncbi:hypothetical protein PTTG_05269 [Puccinia triticina 1-1 BBBD Race 1]|uniref:Carn_acyltransf domain-containing protein n=2 Tax=Puccinia triticina TaxID=208348 RepID=A0A180G745_PUCT1|nr:uncharacterized protein PtA15_1A464 [Puccinia triticina]OAV88309.1 hypothetical protein PTTG_05269 [Puccinia triticina 1-1 BBBD Race 1]WAQ81125.1 hypothetical protein PtA15_1A464 [Puccinia triticina]WAR52015.1 hypothetical protein PtB15_1B454 [Puccinia triticina]